MTGYCGCHSSCHSLSAALHSPLLFSLQSPLSFCAKNLSTQRNWNWHWPLCARGRYTHWHWPASHIVDLGEVSSERSREREEEERERRKRRGNLFWFVFGRPSVKERIAELQKRFEGIKLIVARFVFYSTSLWSKKSRHRHWTYIFFFTN